MDKTDKDTLSLSVIRKAEEIEKFAHDIEGKFAIRRKFTLTGLPESPG